MFSWKWLCNVEIMFWGYYQNKTFFCSTCPCPFILFHFLCFILFYKESGQRVLMAQTLMLYAGHMTKTSLPQLMILAKCTCSLTPVPSQGWDLFCILFSVLAILCNHTWLNLFHFIHRPPAISMVGIAAMWPTLPFSMTTVIFSLLVGRIPAFFNGCSLNHLWASCYNLTVH